MNGAYESGFNMINTEQNDLNDIMDMIDSNNDFNIVNFVENFDYDTYLL